MDTDCPYCADGLAEEFSMDTVQLPEGMKPKNAIYKAKHKAVEFDMKHYQNYITFDDKNTYFLSKPTKSDTKTAFALMDPSMNLCTFRQVGMNFIKSLGKNSRNFSEQSYDKLFCSECEFKKVDKPQLHIIITSETAVEFLTILPRWCRVDTLNDLKLILMADSRVGLSFASSKTRTCRDQECQQSESFKMSVSYQTSHCFGSTIKSAKCGRSCRYIPHSSLRSKNCSKQPKTHFAASLLLVLFMISNLFKTPEATSPDIRVPRDPCSKLIVPRPCQQDWLNSSRVCQLSSISSNPVKLFSVSSQEQLIGCSYYNNTGCSPYSHQAYLGTFDKSVDTSLNNQAIVTSNICLYYNDRYATFGRCTDDLKSKNISYINSYRNGIVISDGSRCLPGCVPDFESVGPPFLLNLKSMLGMPALIEYAPVKCSSMNTVLNSDPLVLAIGVGEMLNCEVISNELKCDSSPINSPFQTLDTSVNLANGIINMLTKRDQIGPHIVDTMFQFSALPYQYINNIIQGVSTSVFQIISSDPPSMMNNCASNKKAICLSLTKPQLNVQVLTNTGYVGETQDFDLKKSFTVLDRNGVQTFVTEDSTSIPHNVKCTEFRRSCICSPYTQILDCNSLSFSEMLDANSFIHATDGEVNVWAPLLCYKGTINTTIPKLCSPERTFDVFRPKYMKSVSCNTTWQSHQAPDETEEIISGDSSFFMRRYEMMDTMSESHNHKRQAQQNKVCGYLGGYWGDFTVGSSLFVSTDHFSITIAPLNSSCGITESYPNKYQYAKPTCTGDYCYETGCEQEVFHLTGQCYSLFFGPKCMRTIRTNFSAIVEEVVNPIGSFMRKYDELSKCTTANCIPLVGYNEFIEFTTSYDAFYTLSTENVTVPLQPAKCIDTNQILPIGEPIYINNNSMSLDSGHGPYPLILLTGSSSKISHVVNSNGDMTLTFCHDNLCYYQAEPSGLVDLYNLLKADFGNSYLFRMTSWARSAYVAQDGKLYVMESDDGCSAIGVSSMLITSLGVLTFTIDDSNPIINPAHWIGINKLCENTMEQIIVKLSDPCPTIVFGEGGYQRFPCLLITVFPEVLPRFCLGHSQHSAYSLSHFESQTPIKDCSYLPRYGLMGTNTRNQCYINSWMDGDYEDITMELNFTTKTSPNHHITPTPTTPISSEASTSQTTTDPSTSTTSNTLVVTTTTEPSTPEMSTSNSYLPNRANIITYIALSTLAIMPNKINLLLQMFFLVHSTAAADHMSFYTTFPDVRDDFDRLVLFSEEDFVVYRQTGRITRFTQLAKVQLKVAFILEDFIRPNCSANDPSNSFLNQVYSTLTKLDNFLFYDLAPTVQASTHRKKRGILDGVLCALTSLFGGCSSSGNEQSIKDLQRSVNSLSDAIDQEMGRTDILMQDVKSLQDSITNTNGKIDAIKTLLNEEINNVNGEMLKISAQEATDTKMLMCSVNILSSYQLHVWKNYVVFNGLANFRKMSLTAGPNYPSVFTPMDQFLEGAINLVNPPIKVENCLMNSANIVKGGSRNYTGVIKLMCAEDTEVGTLFTPDPLIGTLDCKEFRQTNLDLTSLKLVITSPTLSQCDGVITYPDGTTVDLGKHTLIQNQGATKCYVAQTSYIRSVSLESCYNLQGNYFCFDHQAQSVDVPFLLSSVFFPFSPGNHTTANVYPDQQPIFPLLHISSAIWLTLVPGNLDIPGVINTKVPAGLIFDRGCGNYRARFSPTCSSFFGTPYASVEVPLPHTCDTSYADETTIPHVAIIMAARESNDQMIEQQVRNITDSLTQQWAEYLEAQHDFIAAFDTNYTAYNTKLYNATQKINGYYENFTKSGYWVATNVNNARREAQNAVEDIDTADSAPTWVSWTALALGGVGTVMGGISMVKIVMAEECDDLVQPSEITHWVYLGLAGFMALTMLSLLGLIIFKNCFGKIKLRMQCLFLGVLAAHTIIVDLFLASRDQELHNLFTFKASMAFVLTIANITSVTAIIAFLIATSVVIKQTASIPMPTIKPSVQPLVLIDDPDGDPFTPYGIGMTVVAIFLLVSILIVVVCWALYCRRDSIPSNWKVSNKDRFKSLFHRGCPLGVRIRNVHTSKLGASSKSEVLDDVYLFLGLVDGSELPRKIVVQHKSYVAHIFGSKVHFLADITWAFKDTDVSYEKACLHNKAFIVHGKHLMEFKPELEWGDKAMTKEHVKEMGKQIKKEEFQTTLEEMTTPATVAADSTPVKKPRRKAPAKPVLENISGEELYVDGELNQDLSGPAISALAQFMSEKGVHSLSTPASVLDMLTDSNKGVMNSVITSAVPELKAVGMLSKLMKKYNTDAKT